MFHASEINCQLSKKLLPNMSIVLSFEALNNDIGIHPSKKFFEICRSKRLGRVRLS